MSKPASTPEERDTMEDILKVEDLQVHFPVMKGVLFKKQVATVKAVDGVSFSVQRGETLSVVGESGCGKSTTGLALMHMLHSTSGRILFEGQDVTSFSCAQAKQFRRRVQMVYQDPYGSLNPRMKVKDIIGEPLQVHGLDKDRQAYEQRIADLLRMVGLLPDMAERYAHEFSGGQRQRIGIARALALEPSLLVCDEPVSALDVSIQAQVINIFKNLQKRLGLTYVFIAHDLAVVRHISDRIAVMYLGRVVEIAARDDLYQTPKHPYTQALLSAVLVADVDAEASKERVVLKGEIPSPLRIPSGCRFHTRCPVAMERCKTQDPGMSEHGRGHAVACHLYT
ncbi:oligopeptide/dipeptide ABC transporter, ATPase subunit [Verminephrobacter eiseniae EF01-2]|uniref:Oligopeptide/dipeptide ABC transporter, ATPase subunit n=2 Tax=Verminephrobacter eiseniae TaxID=364317 RepID=A1WSP2_VEREI|nr:oligopeptide/dipeptide ABC transporter, ATPase subunit [Verminephrobacter eiseniae EF01-2]